MLEIETYDEWTPAFDHYIAQWGDLNITERRISRIVRHTIRENYRTQGGHSGVPWDQRTTPHPHPPLQKSGYMMQQQLALSVQKWQSSGSIQTMDFSPIALQATHYSIFFHTGTSKMPPRITIIIDHYAEAEIILVMEAHMLEY